MADTRDFSERLRDGTGMRTISDAQKVQLRMGAYYEHRGQFSKAKNWYSRAAKGNDPEADFRLGNLAYRSENYTEAIGHLRKAVAGGITRIEAFKRLALSFERLGDRYSAEELVHLEVAKSPSNVHLKELLDSLRARNGQYELRQLNLEKAGSSPGDKSTDMTSLISKDDPAWLRADFLSARLDDRRSDPDWLYNYATVLEEAGRLAEAAAIFDEACALEPSHSWWWYRSGRVYELSEDCSQARQRYFRAVECDNKYESRKWGVGVFHHEGRNWDLAGREFEESAIAASEVWRRAGLFFRAGHNYLLAVNFDDAERCLTRALRLRPGDVKWSLMLADTLELRGDFKQAAGILEFLMVSRDLSEADRRTTSWAAGRTLRLAGDFESSVSRLRSALPITAIEDERVEHGDCSKAAKHAGDLAPDALVASDLFQGSTDRRGHMERARIAQRVHAHDVQADSLRKAELLSGTNENELAKTYSKLLLEAGRLERAAEVLLRTRVYWGPYPDEYSQPKEGSYAYQLAAYKQWRESLSLEPDVILYESNLGLSIDCNPLALCRNLLTTKDRFVHVWAIDGKVTVPEDLLEHSDVLVVQKNSLQYIRLLATANYLVNNSTFPTYFTRRDDQRYLMTWHGTPLKTLAKDMPEPLVHLNMARNYLQATHAIYPNEHTRRVLVERMDLNGLLSAHRQISGYPRNDSLAAQQSKTIPPATGATVLFAPTWREDSELENQVDVLLKVRNLIVAAGHTPLIRAHHYVESAALAVDPEISFVPRRVPTNDLLLKADILITDFSSIFFDFAITRRPILFYAPDWERYAETRGLYFSKGQLPGPVCETLEQLRTELNNPKVNQKTRQKFLDEFAPMDDGHATVRVSDWFFDLETTRFASEPVDANTEEQEDRGLLIRQAFIPNGMTSSFINLVRSLTDRGVDVTVLTDGRSVQNEPARQGTLIRLPEVVRVVGRVGMQAKSMIEYHGSLASTEIAGPPSWSLERVLDDMYKFEARRVLPVGGFSAAIEFDGYSEFMARLIHAIGEDSGSTAIYLHNDIYDEIHLRMPELKGVVEILPKFEHVVAVSEGSSIINSEKLSSAYGIDTSKFTFARNTILPDRIVELGREQLPPTIREFFENSDISVVQVGRISPEKNHAFSLDLIASMRRQGVDCRLVIVGDGPLCASVTRKISDLDLEAAIKIVGWVDNPYPYISNVDAMLLPSSHEGQPMVILEAQTLGTPVIGSLISSLEAMGEIGPQHLLPLDLDEWVQCLLKMKRSRSIDSVVFDGNSYAEQAIKEFFSAIGLSDPSTGYQTD